MSKVTPRDLLLRMGRRQLGYQRGDPEMYEGKMACEVDEEPGESKKMGEGGVLRRLRRLYIHMNQAISPRVP